MEKYNKNLGYYYLKQRFETYYFNNEDKLKSLDFKVDTLKQEFDALELHMDLDKLYFSVSYPGLLIGTGTTLEFTDIEENKKDINNNYKLGINFDYTSGLPYIPGSSIKGVLRSYFPDSLNNSEDAEAKAEIINFFLKKDYSISELELLRDFIFEGGNEELDYIAIAKRDKFIEGKILLKNGTTKVLEEDYITPHKNVLASPVPLQILKLVPESQLVLFFKLFDTEIGNIKVTKEEKLELFKQILFFSGLGAKTNTGYGHFNCSQSNELDKDRKREILEVLENKKNEEEEKNLTPIQLWERQFDKKDAETKKREYEGAMELFPEEENKKVVARHYLDFFKKEKQTDKTKKKVKKLQEFLGE